MILEVGALEHNWNSLGTGQVPVGSIQRGRLGFIRLVVVVGIIVVRTGHDALVPLYTQNSRT